MPAAWCSSLTYSDPRNTCWTARPRRTVDHHSHIALNQRNPIGFETVQSLACDLIMSYASSTAVSPGKVTPSRGAVRLPGETPLPDGHCAPRRRRREPVLGGHSGQSRSKRRCRAGLSRPQSIDSSQTRTYQYRKGEHDIRRNHRAVDEHNDYHSGQAEIRRGHPAIQRSVATEVAHQGKYYSNPKNKPRWA